MARSYDIKAMALEIRARARREQGLPENMTPAVADRLAELLDDEPLASRRAS